MLHIYREYLLWLQCNASGRTTNNDFAEQRFRFSHFEVSIIPQYQGILQINTVALLDYGKLFASLRISGDRP